MKRVNLTNAKAHLSQLVKSAAAGESVIITRCGNPVSQLGPITKSHSAIDAATLRAMTDGMPKQAVTAAVATKPMRDEDRY